MVRNMMVVQKSAVAVDLVIVLQDFESNQVSQAEAQSHKCGPESWSWRLKHAQKIIHTYPHNLSHRVSYQQKWTLMEEREPAERATKNDEPYMNAMRLQGLNCNGRPEI